MLLKFLILTTLLLSTLSNILPHIGKAVSRTPRTYNISLNLPLQQRWAPIIKDYSQGLKRFMYFFDFLPIPQRIFDRLDQYGHTKCKHQDLVAEIDVISKLSGYPFGKLFFLNWMYEFSTLKGCSSILIRNSDDKIMHGRNLDFSMWSLIARLIVKINYYDEDELVYSVDTVVGSAFALTGIRHGSYAISVDTRHGGKLKDIWRKVTTNEGMPNAWLVRKVLEEEDSYEDALERLKNERIKAPIYYIISGIEPNEGAVIERDPDGVKGFYTLNKTVWFLVQTNYDRDRSDPLLDRRRAGVQKKIKKRGNEDFNEQELYQNIMSVWPTFNIQTISTTIMVPVTGYHNTTVWYAENPKGRQTPTKF